MNYRMKILKRSCVWLCIKISWKESVLAKTDDQLESQYCGETGVLWGQRLSTLSRAGFSLLDQPFLTRLFINNL